MYHTVYHTLVLLTLYQINLPYLPHTCSITTLSDYVPYYLPYTCTIARLLTLFTILLITHLNYYYIIRLIYHILVPLLH